ncbi:MAG: TRAP transporter small permease subunit [Gammaproteobacteria bacterium]|jgi:TRAP-type C4-dicarboxylate transport system permease small subunit|nr:C4-dicarboxylate ABC transporter permease [Chromatiales bacterium]MDP6675758.1 TRAP transporter small permease subunit [Gammaproteobacteria bacterium]
MIHGYNRLINGLANVAGLIIAAVCLLIVYDVITRNLGLQPPASTVALTEYAMLYFTMAAAPYLVRTKGHIVVEIVYLRLSLAARRRLDKFILVLCMLAALIVAILAFILLLESLQRGEIEVRSLDAPRWILFAPLFVGFLLMATEFLRLLLRSDSVFSSATGPKESF